MKWILEHIQALIVIAGAIAWWLNQRRQAQSEDAAPPPKRAEFEDPDLAERTRRIREEIQRKIEERARRSAGQPPVETEEPMAGLPPILRELLDPQTPVGVPVEPRPVRPAAADRAEAGRQAEILEQQAALAEKLREAEFMKEAAQKRRAFEDEISSAPDEAVVSRRTPIAADLGSPEALRRAFLLREVLGPPVALR